MGCNTHAISAASVSTRGLSGFTLNSRVKMVTPARSDLFRPGPSRGPGDVSASGPHDRPPEHWAGPTPLSPPSTQRKEGRREGEQEGKREGANPSQPRGQTRNRAGKGEGEDPHPGWPRRPPRPRPALAPPPRRVPSAPAALTSSSCSLRKHRHAARFLKPSRS